VAAPPNRKPPSRPPGAARPVRRGSRVPQLRLLPVTIVVAAAMLMVRVNDIWTSVNALVLPHLALNQSEAQQPPPPGGKKKKNDPQPTQPAGVAPAGSTPAPTAASAPSGTDKTAGAAPAAGTAGGGDAAPAAVPGGQATEGEPPIFTQNEVDVLEKLSARRQALDGREHDVELRENLLKAAEERIDKKIAEMQALQKDVQGMLQKVDEEDDAKIKSLVKIYETMKPKDAARIFEQLEMPVLLKVVEGMKDTKVSGVMEVMDSGKAKALTDAIAARRATKIEGAATSADAGAPAAPAAGAPATPPAPGG
jgi:flagellar motility protein MotE (MotC chaperone)